MGKGTSIITTTRTMHQISSISQRNCRVGCFGRIASVTREFLSRHSPVRMFVEARPFDVNLCHHFCGIMLVPGRLGPGHSWQVC